MPFLLAEILNFQGSTHHIGVGSFSKVNIIFEKCKGVVHGNKCATLLYRQANKFMFSKQELKV